MILLIMLLIALSLSLPLLLVLRRRTPLTARRDAALALYRAQLASLDAQSIPDYDDARLEIERRLLLADKLPTEPTGGSAKILLILTVIILPIGAFLLYLPGATPFVPSEPHARLMAEQNAAQQKLALLIHLLRTHLAHTPANSVNASQGQAYLAEALTEQAGKLTPEAIRLFKESLAHAPLDASWRQLDEQRLMQASSQSS